MQKLIKTNVYLLYWLLSCVLNTPRNKAVVLMYHAVCAHPCGTSVSSEAFERQMQYLAQRKKVVQLETVVDAYLNKTLLPAGTVAITFDDGYLDLQTTVLPIIKKYRIPITVFVPSDVSVPTDMGNRERLSKDELTELVDTGFVSIEAHSQTHARLTDLNDVQLERELVNSQKELFSIIGVQPTFVAYPYGARNMRVEAATANAGYKAGFGITDGFVGSSKTLYGLHRVQTDQTMSFLLFQLRLTAAVEVARMIRQKRKSIKRFFFRALRKCKNMLTSGSTLTVSISKEDWDKKFANGGWDRLVEEGQKNTQVIAQQVCIRAAEKGAPFVVVDLGAGNGALAKMLSEETLISYVGVDISSEALKQAYRHHPAGEYIQHDLSRGPLPEVIASADMVVCNEFIYYVPTNRFLYELSQAITSDTEVIFSYYQSWRSPLLSLMIRRNFKNRKQVLITDTYTHFPKWTIVSGYKK